MSTVAVSRSGGHALLAPLRSSRAWCIALAVGTLINGYGQLLVPWLNGRQDVWADLLERARATPGTTALSALLAYLFPLGVSLYSAAGVRRDCASLASRAQFPDARPDPVFRVSRDGAIVELGERTRALFESRGVTSARQLLGERTWQALLAAEAPQRMRVHVPGLDAWFLLSHAPGPPETLNIYLTALEGEAGPEAGGA